MEDIQKSLEIISRDLSSIEQELLPQLDGLAQAIPEIYAGYASMVRELVSTTMNLFDLSGKSGTRVAVAAEIGARSIEAYGEYKAAKEHNRLLHKYMTVKTAYARANDEKIQGVLPRVKACSDRSAKIFMKCSELSYDISELDSSKIEKVAAIQLQALSMHRTNIYLLELCKYLRDEYKVWISGKQTSENDMPDYYLINSILSEHLFGEDLFGAYEGAADSMKRLKGKQIMLLSDYQFSMMALGSQLCRIDISKAHPIVAKLIGECGATQEYHASTESIVSHINGNPTRNILIMATVVIAVIIGFVATYVNADDGIKWILGLVSVGIATRISLKGITKARIGHVQKGLVLMEECDKNIEAVCGKVERPDIDYNERNALSSAIGAFFK